MSLEALEPAMQWIVCKCVCACASYPNPWDNECAGIFSFGVETVYAILVLPRFRYPPQDCHQEPPRRARARAPPSLSPPRVRTVSRPYP